MLTNMGASAVHKLNEKISEELIIEFYEEQESVKPSLTLFYENTLEKNQNNDISLNIKCSLSVANIEGVFLPIYSKENYKYHCENESCSNNIVRVESTRKNLRSIALGVASGKAVCLFGPVGCGKTTIVEHLAQITGRITFGTQNFQNNTFELNRKNKRNGPLNLDTCTKRKFNIEEKVIDTTADTMKQIPKNEFLRIQLGDQIDGKMLLGQYHCTDVPGEFIWIPGVLTQVCIIIKRKESLFFNYVFIGSHEWLLVTFRRFRLCYK